MSSWAGPGLWDLVAEVVDPGFRRTPEVGDLGYKCKETAAEVSDLGCRAPYLAALIALTSSVTAESEVLISPCRNLVTTSA